MLPILLGTVLLALIWAYVGYPLFIASPAGRLLPAPRACITPLGRTWLLISAHDEETVLEPKLENSLALEGESLRVVVVSDGSGDRTDEIAQEFSALDSRVQLLRVDERRGKNHALNEAFRRLPIEPHDVVVFSDANAMYASDAVVRLRDALAGGAACAVGRLDFVDETTGTARAEGLYWRYENAIKVAEGRLGRLLVANGAIFATRAADVPELPLGVGNDFWIPVRLLGRGFPVTYERRAVAREPAPARGREEFQRKVRMANRSMNGTIVLWGDADAATRLQLVSHKVLRWLGLPLYATALLIAGAAVATGAHLAILAGLLAPLLLAAVGVAGRALGWRVPLADLGVHFLLVHAAAMLGVIEALRGKERLTWERAHSARRVTI